jgi:hypothetical protein
MDPMDELPRAHWYLMQRQPLILIGRVKKDVTTGIMSKLLLVNIPTSSHLLLHLIWSAAEDTIYGGFPTISDSLE